MTMANPNPEIVDLTNSDDESEDPLYSTAEVSDKRDRLEKERRDRESNNNDSTARRKMPLIKQERDIASACKRKHCAKKSTGKMTGAGDQMNANPDLCETNRRRESNKTEASTMVRSNKCGSFLGLVREMKNKQSSQNDEYGPRDPKSLKTYHPSSANAASDLQDKKLEGGQAPEDSQVGKEHQIQVQEEEGSKIAAASESVSTSVHDGNAVKPSSGSASSASESLKKRTLSCSSSPSKDDSQDYGSIDETPNVSPPKTSRTGRGDEIRTSTSVATAVDSASGETPWFRKLKKRKPAEFRQDRHQIEKVRWCTKEVVETFPSFQKALDAANASAKDFKESDYDPNVFENALARYRQFGFDRGALYNGYIWRFKDEVVVEPANLVNPRTKMNGPSQAVAPKADDENGGPDSLTPTSPDAGSPEESTVSQSGANESIINDPSSAPDIVGNEPAGVDSIDAGQSPAIRLKSAGLDGDGQGNDPDDPFDFPGTEHDEDDVVPSRDNHELKSTGLDDDGQGNNPDDPFDFPGTEHDEDDVVPRRDNHEDNHSDDDDDDDGKHKNDNAPSSICGETAEEEVAKDGGGDATDEVHDEGKNSYHKSSDLLVEESQEDDGVVSASVNSSSPGGDEDDKSNDLFVDETPQDDGVVTAAPDDGDEDDDAKATETSPENEDDIAATAGASSTSSPIENTGSDSSSSSSDNDDPMLQSEVDESSLFKQPPNKKYLWMLLLLLSALIVVALWLLLLLFVHLKFGESNNIIKTILDGIVKKCGCSTNKEGIVEIDVVVVEVPTPSPQEEPTASSSSIFYPPALPWHLQKWL